MPEAGLRFTRSIEDLRPADEYLEAVGKYRHLDAAQVEHIQARLDKDVGLLKELAARGSQADARAGRLSARQTTLRRHGGADRFPRHSRGI